MRFLFTECCCIVLLLVLGDVSARTLLRSQYTKRHAAAEHTNGSRGAVDVATTGQKREDNPCQPLLDEIAESDEAYPIVDGPKTKQCLDAVKVDKLTIEDHIDALKAATEWQSTLTLLSDVDTMAKLGLQPVDVRAELDRILVDVLLDRITSQLDFETQLSLLYRSCHDAHFMAEGPLVSVGAVVGWLRGKDSVIVSISGTPRDRSSTQPTLNRVSDLYNNLYNPLVSINGEPASEFIRKQSEISYAQDAHARWNQQFFSAAAPNFPSMAYSKPPFYPGPETTVKYSDGTVVVQGTQALLLKKDWEGIATPEDVYDRFIRPYGQNPTIKRRNTVDDHDGDGEASRNGIVMDGDWGADDVIDDDNAEREQVLWEYFGLQQLQATQQNLSMPDTHVDRIARGLPPTVLHETISHSLPRLRVAGHFQRMGKVPVPVAILEVGSFSDQSMETISFFERFFKLSIRLRCRRLIIDLRHNAGGSPVNRETLSRLLTGIRLPEPVTLKRFRSHPAVRKSGSIYEKFGGPLYNSFYLGSVFHPMGGKLNFATGTVDETRERWLMDANSQPYRTWKSLEGPVISGHDVYSKNYVYGPWNEGLTSEADFLAAAVADAADAVNVPFEFQDIAILTDGYCSSACALFVGEMKTHAPLATILTVGGDPWLPSPSSASRMPAAGATKGTALITTEQLADYADFTAERLPSIDDPLPGPVPFPTDYLPTHLQLRMAHSTVNFEDAVNVRDLDLPLQFVVEPADCHFFYTRDTALFSESMWRKVYNMVFDDVDAGGSTSDGTTCAVQ